MEISTCLVSTLLAATDLVQAFNNTLVITLGAVIFFGWLFVRRFL